MPDPAELELAGRARLEAFLAPQLLAALDEYIHELVGHRIAEAAAASRTDREWYPLDEAARRLGCSYDAARMRAKRGRLEVRRQGRTVLVSARSMTLSLTSTKMALAARQRPRARP